jgi:hypothetical protein
MARRLRMNPIALYGIYGYHSRKIRWNQVKKQTDLVKKHAQLRKIFSYWFLGLIRI